MSKLKVKATSQFKKDYKLAKKRGKDTEQLDNVIRMIANAEPLPDHMRDHGLSGSWQGFRECHVEPDWLLIYATRNDLLVLSLMRTGSHSDLFG